MRKRMVTLPLPGDEGFILAYQIARAIRRDGKLTYDEWNAQACGRACAYVRTRYLVWYCSVGDRCVYCEELE